MTTSSHMRKSEVGEVRPSQTLTTFGIGSLKLPDVEEAETPRVLLEERITMLRDFCETIDNLFESFLKTRGSSSWEGQTTMLRRWIAQSTRNTAVAAVA